MVAFGAPSNVALAASDVWLESASDGKLLIVGEGWHPGQQLSVSLGGDRFVAYVDSAGGFEVSTGVPVFQREPLAVHHVQTVTQALAQLEAAQAADRPQALALWFAEGLESGAALLAGCAGVLAAVYLVARTVRRRGYPRR